MDPGDPLILQATSSNFKSGHEEVKLPDHVYKDRIKGKPNHSLNLLTSTQFSAGMTSSIQDQEFKL